MIFKGAEPAIYVFDNAGTISGTAAPDRTITGASVVLSEGCDIVVDPVSDILYVTSGIGSRVQIWNNASTADGNLAPDRMISGAGTTLNNPSDIVGVR